MVMEESLCIQKKRVTKVGMLCASDFTPVIFIKVHPSAVERDFKKFSQMWIDTVYFLKIHDNSQRF